MRKKRRLLLVLLFNALFLSLFFKLVNSQAWSFNVSDVEKEGVADSGGDFLVVVTPSHTVVGAGQAISVTATLYNDTTDTCMGIPQFNLHVNSNPTNPSVFEPVNMMSPVYYLTLFPGDSVETVFNITAASPGTATFFVSANGEASPWGDPGCPGPFYWKVANGISGEVFVLEELMTNFIPLLRRP